MCDNYAYMELKILRKHILKLTPLQVLMLTNITGWASLVAQMVKSLPAIQETWVRSLGWEDPL